jgi:glycine hydroxymethyltransferase
MTVLKKNIFSYCKRKKFIVYLLTIPFDNLNLQYFYVIIKISFSYILLLSIMNNKKSDLFQLLHQEIKRQDNTWNLIASENKCYEEIFTILGSALQNKYAEGIPGHRYYEGCTYIDEIEKLAEDNAKKLFNAEYVNTQPHCGSSANLIAYYTCCHPQDTILAMDFSSGGHLSHGYKKNISGMMYNFIHYKVKQDTHLIDYDEIEKLIKMHKPKIVISGASSYSRIINYEYIFHLTQKYNCIHMVDMAHIAGLIAAKAIPSPVPFADIITSTTHKTLRGPRGGFIMSKGEWQKKIQKAVLPGVQGGPFINTIAAKAWIFDYAQKPDFIAYQKNILKNTQLMVGKIKAAGIPIITDGSDIHLFLIDLRKYQANGKIIAKELAANNIYCNHNAIPYDPLPPTETSGIRIGTSFITAQKKTDAEILDMTDTIISIIKKYE